MGWKTLTAIAGSFAILLMNVLGGTKKFAMRSSMFWGAGAIAVTLAVTPTPSVTAAVCQAGSDCLVINNNIVLSIDENFPPGGQETRLTLNGNFGVWAVVLTEPIANPDSNGGIISDVLISNGTQLLFGSDDPFHVNMPGGLVPPPGAVVIPETAGFIDLSGFLPPGGGRYTPVPDPTFIVTSLLVASDVPEPRTLLLLGSGLLWLASLSRRGRRRS